MNYRLIALLLPVLILGGIFALLYPFEEILDGGSPVDISPLYGSKWTLQSLTLDRIIINLSNMATINIEFDDEGVAKGSGGCNTFSAKYQLSDKYEINATTVQDDIEMGAGGTISIIQLTHTERACVEPDLMTQENQYFSALGIISSFEVIPVNLKLSSEDGKSVLIFIKE
jgi:heat shock protein HslJ